MKSFQKQLQLELQQSIGAELRKTKKALAEDFISAGIRVSLNDDTLNRLEKEPMEIQQWTAKGPLRWILYVTPRDGKLRCELWTLRGDPKREFTFLAEPGELSISGKTIRKYDISTLNRMRDMFIQDAYGQVPQRYRGVEIRNGNNIAHADVWAVTKDRQVYKLERESTEFGRYSIEVPEGTDILIVDEHNTVLGDRRAVFVDGGLRRLVEIGNIVRSVLSR